jgi:WD40 repeat protein
VLASTTFATIQLENALIVQTSEDRLFVMDLSGDEPVTLVETELKFPIYPFVSPDERYLAVTNDKQIEIWNLQNPEIPLFDLERQQGKYIAPTFTADSRWLVYAVEDKIFALDLSGETSNNPIELSGNRHGSIVSEFFTLGHWLISRSTSEVLAWDTTAALSTMRRLSRSTAASVEYLSEVTSSWILIQQPGAVLAWDTTDLGTEPIIFNGEFGSVEHDRWVITIGENALRLWDLSQPDSPVSEFIDYGLSESGNWLYYWDQENVLHLLDLKSANPQPIALKESEGAYPLFSPDDQWVGIMPQEGGPPSLYKLTATMQKLNLPGDKTISLFSPDGKWLVLISTDHIATSLYELSNNLTKLPVSFPVPDFSPVLFSPDGHWLVLQDRFQRTALFDLQARELFPETFPSSDTFEISPDGRWLIGDLQENNRTSALLIDLNDPARSFTLQGHTDQIIGKYFSPDGQSLLTYGFDRTIRIWDLKNPAKDPVVLRHDASVEGVAVSENGKWLISNTPQGVYIWQWAIEDVRNLACRLAGRNLTRDEWAKYIGEIDYQKTCEQWP